MRMLDMQVNELEQLGKLTESEAAEFVAEGVKVICQIGRDIYEVWEVAKLNQLIALRNSGVYSSLKFYIK